MRGAQLLGAGGHVPTQLERLAILSERPPMPLAQQMAASQKPKPQAAQVALDPVLVRIPRQLPERREIRGPVFKTPHQAAVNPCLHRPNHRSVTRTNLSFGAWSRHRRRAGQQDRKPVRVDEMDGRCDWHRCHLRTPTVPRLRATAPRQQAQVLRNLLVHHSMQPPERLEAPVTVQRARYRRRE